MQGKPGNYREAQEAREAWGLSEGQELWGAPGRAKTLGTVGSASEARHQAKPSLSDILWHSDTSHSYHTRLLRFLMSQRCQQQLWGEKAVGAETLGVCAGGFR